MRAASRRWIPRVILFACALLVVGGTYFLWNVRDVVLNCYAQWGAGELVVRFHENRNRLPSGWDELRSTFESGGAHHAIGLGFDDVMERVQIDFDRLHFLATHPGELDEAPEVIFATNGSQSHYEGAEPNQIVVRYFQALDPKND